MLKENEKVNSEEYLEEPARRVPVRACADVFVAGGSCTGVFAAVRAARLGAKVVLVERENCLGGTATAALVNVWHSLKDTDYQNQIIAGLTGEMTERLVRSGSAVLDDNPSTAITFDPNRLKYELDRLVAEEKIDVYLHTMCVGALTDGERISAAQIENKDGRGAVKASFYIDATGDGDLARALAVPSRKELPLQPPTPCFLMLGSFSGVDFGKIIAEHGAEVGLEDDFGWGEAIPGLPGISLRADFHVFGADCSTAEGLTFVETEGRRKAYAMVELINRYAGTDLHVASFSSLAGVRETLHFDTRTQACGVDMLRGMRYDDAVLNGTYRLDLHDEAGGVTFYYLDGSRVRITGAQRNEKHENWRQEEKISGEPAKFYQIPFSVLVQEKYRNLIAAGRMINADKLAYGGLRVMVNLNQLGEAAGVAAYLSLDENLPVQKIDGVRVRKLLRKGGSAL